MSPPQNWIDAAQPGRFYRVCRVLVRGLLKSCFAWQPYHANRIPPVGPLILAANHVSFADPPLIGAAIERPVTFLARETLFDVPLLNPLIRSLNAIPVDRDGGSPGGLRTVLSRLEAGAAVLLFPEGTRSPDGRLQSARSGIGLIVIRTTAPVIPIRIFGLYEIWGRHRKFPKLGPVGVKYGRPLDFHELRAEAVTASKQRTKAIYDEISREIMAAIGRLEPCRDVTSFP